MNRSMLDCWDPIRVSIVTLEIDSSFNVASITIDQSIFSYFYRMVECYFMHSLSTTAHSVAAGILYVAHACVVLYGCSMYVLCGITNKEI